jgi:hypothetical protein
MAEKPRPFDRDTIEQAFGHLGDPGAKSLSGVSLRDEGHGDASRRYS